MADPNNPERPEITFWTPLAPDLDPPLWSDGSAFQYPVNREDDAPEHTNLPFTLDAYEQIITTHRFIVPETLIPEPPVPQEPKVWKKTDVEELRTAIETDQYEMEWLIATEDVKTWHEDVVNDFRRASAYPNTTVDQDDVEPSEIDPVPRHVIDMAPYTYNHCFGKATEGFRWLAEKEQGTISGWHDYVGQQLAEPGQTHRFWIWTRFFDSGVWFAATVGPIGVDGTILEPFGGTNSNTEDEWADEPQEDDYPVIGYFQLVQMVQDIEPDVDLLTTATRPIRGKMYDAAYETLMGSDCTTTCNYYGCCGDPEAPYGWVDWSYTTNSYTTYGCSGWQDTYSHSESGTSKAGWWGPPLHCTCNQGTSWSFSSTDSAWEWELEWGADFFHTWEYYIDAIFSS